MKQKKDNKKVILLVLILLAMLMLILIALGCLGKIDNKQPIPTGNVDIFDVIFEVGDKVATNIENADINNEQENGTNNNNMIVGKIKKSKKNNNTNQSQKNDNDSITSYNGSKTDSNSSKTNDNNSKPSEDNPKPGEDDPKPGEDDPKPGEDDPKPGEDDPKPGEDDPKPGEDDPEPEGGVKVYDKETTWSNWTKLNIFKNASYFVEDNKIAPASENSYQFVIRNNNDFNVKYDLKLSENNDFNINMRYRLKQNGEYIVGDDNEYVTYDKLNQYNVNLVDNAYDVYTLDWKWVESENDTQIGEQDIDVNYRLNLQILAMQV